MSLDRGVAPRIGCRSGTGRNSRIATFPLAACEIKTGIETAIAESAVGMSRPTDDGSGSSP